MNLIFNQHLGRATISAIHRLSPIPYVESALEPVISAKTIYFFYGNHHKA
jgi:superoxide dismutase